MRNNKGQHVIEVILLVAAVLVFFAIFLKPQSAYKGALEKNTFDSTIHVLEKARDEIKF